MLILDDVVYTARVWCVARPRQVFSFLENEGDRYADKSTIASRAEKTRDANGTREEEMDSIASSPFTFHTSFLTVKLPSKTTSRAFVKHAQSSNF